MLNLQVNFRQRHLNRSRHERETARHSTCEENEHLTRSSLGDTAQGNFYKMTRTRKQHLHRHCLRGGPILFAVPHLVLGRVECQQQLAVGHGGLASILQVHFQSEVRAETLHLYVDTDPRVTRPSGAALRDPG
jgi:hypothetical protein